MSEQKAPFVRLMIVVGIITAVLAVFFFALVFDFELAGNPVPDPTTGRIFPVQMHGAIYVTEPLGTLFYGLFATIVALILSMAVIVFLRKDRKS
ncbi:MAG TPA: hypothetical protein VGG48_17485 [Rhizomicrobium sp.]